MDLFLFPFIAFFAVVVFIPLAIRVAPALKLMDAPDARKTHEGEVPLIGGLIIFPIFIACAIFAGFSWGTHWPLYSAIALLLFTGAIDDKAHLSAWVKFFIQFCAAGLVIIPGGAQLHNLGDLFSLGDLGLDFMSLPFSFAAVVLLINAVNLMDGLDGLAAGFSALALSWIAIGFFAIGYMAGVLIVVILVAAIVGFLIYNLRHPFRKKASLFLGDAGSLCLGLCLAWFAIHVAKHPELRALQPISVAWILAIPIFDTCAQFYRRACEGRHPFSPDRGHFHHHFVNAGLSDGRATGVILLLALLSGAFGVFALWLGVPQAVVTFLWVGGLLGHMALSRYPERYISFVSRVFKIRK